MPLKQLLWQESLELERLETEVLEFLTQNLLKETTKNTFRERDDIYRKKAKKNALKTITKARKSRANLKRKADEDLGRIREKSLEVLKRNTRHKRLGSSL